MAISLKAEGTFVGNSFSGSIQTINFSSCGGTLASYTTQAGDCIVVAYSISGSTVPTLFSGASATWVVEDSGFTAPVSGMAIGYGCIAGQDTFTIDGHGNQGDLVIAVLGGVATTSPIGTLQSNALGSGTSLTTPSLSYTAGQAVLGMGGEGFSPAWNASSWSDGNTNHNVAQSNSQRGVTLDFELPASSGSTTYTANISNPQTMRVVAVTLNALPPPPTSALSSSLAIAASLGSNAPPTAAISESVAVTAAPVVATTNAAALSESLAVAATASKKVNITSAISSNLAVAPTIESVGINVRAVGTSQASSTSSLSVTISSVGQSGRLILFVSTETNSSTPATVSSMTGMGVAWTQRAHTSNTTHGQATEEWYADFLTNMTGGTVSVTMSGTIDDSSIIAIFAIPDSLHNAVVFDTNASLPAVLNGSAGGTFTTAVSTNTTSPYVLLSGGSSSSAHLNTPTPVSTSLGSISNAGAVLWQFADVYGGPDAQLASTTAGFGTGPSGSWTVIIDAIAQVENPANSAISSALAIAATISTTRDNAALSESLAVAATAGRTINLTAAIAPSLAVTAPIRTTADTATVNDSLAVAAAMKKTIALTSAIAPSLAVTANDKPEVLSSALSMSHGFTAINPPIHITATTASTLLIITADTRANLRAASAGVLALIPIYSGNFPILTAAVGQDLLVGEASSNPIVMIL